MSNTPRPDSPFVGLVPFLEEDAPFFRGREAERDLIVENLRASRLTLLYGTSGVGKSSVLYAGAAHRLRQLARQDAEAYGRPEFAVVTFNAWRDDPIPGLLRAIGEAVTEALQSESPLPAPPASGDLVQDIDAWTERYGVELLIILDQFEEYFQYHPGEQGPASFAVQFPRAVNAPELRAKFLISLRDDALSQLDRFKPLIPHLFDNLLRIRHMNQDAARKAIVEPIDYYNELWGLKGTAQAHGIEPELVEDVLGQVRAERNAAEAADEVRIEAPYLQLVMTSLWDKEREVGSRVIRKKTLEDLKGIKNIVQVYLDDALATLKAEEAAVAFRIFDYLVTPSGTKIAYFESDLIGKTKFTKEQVGGVLDALNKRRILRPVESPPERREERRDDRRFEVFHDLLARAMINWQTQYSATAETAARLVEVERLRREQAKARENRRLRGGIALLTVLLLGAGAFTFIALSLNRRANSALAAQADSAAKANTAKAEAVKQAEVAAQNLSRVRELEAELEKIEQETNDPIIKQRLAQFRSNVRVAIGMTSLNLSEQAQREISPLQQRESASGRAEGYVLAGDMLLSKLWANGKTLRFRFLGGSPALRQRIEQVAQEWTQYANIKFVFDDSPDAEIRIGFDRGGTWSFIGTDALAVPRNRPTMNFGWFTQSTPEVELRRTVLHTFGQVLGLINEHLNPNANIPWNKEAIYRVFAGPPNNWSRAQVDANFFATYRGKYRAFDPQSVMMYAFPKEIFTDPTFPNAGGGPQLSDSDMRFIRELYPPTN